MSIVQPAQLDTVIAALQGGAVVAIPTDTVYGLVARADDRAAVGRLIAMKGRDPEKPIQLLIDDPEHVAAWLEPAEALQQARAHWPGALTAVLRVRGDLPLAVVTGQGTIGIRQPDDLLARRVLRALGGSLAASSANVAGADAALTAAQVAAAFGPDLLVLDGGPRLGGRGSTVVDWTREPPVLLRVGDVSATDLGLDAAP